MKTETKTLTTKLQAMADRSGTQLPETTKKSSLQTIFENQVPSIRKALAGTEQDANRFMRICLSIVTKNDKLLNIARQNPYEVLSACLKMAALGLDPAIPNEAHLVPYGKEVVLVVGYKGLQKGALNAASEMHNPISAFVTEIVYDTDEFEYSKVPFFLKHKRKDPFGKKGNILGFYCYARLTNGMEFVELMSNDEILAHKKQYLKTSSGPFNNGNNSDLYGIKTVMMRLIRRQLPMSPKMTALVQAADDSSEYPQIPTDEILGLNVGQNEINNTSIDVTPEPPQLSDEEMMAEEARKTDLELSR